jgi:mannose/fructose/N-acetylgalactosamine-specific phosphotransferase system component IIC
MRTENFIDDFIRDEKQTEPNPFLTTRIMAEVEKMQQTEIKIVPWWQVVVFVASIVAVVFLGITLGNSYINPISQEITMNINDNEIENFGYYSLNSHE